MPIASIDRFDLGIKTHGDLLDSGKFENMENLEIDKPGMAYRRDAQKIIATMTGYDIRKRIVRWVHASLVGGAEWIMKGVFSGKDIIRRYQDDWDDTNAIDIKDFDTASEDGDTTQIIPFDREIRFANGQTRKAGLYQHIGRDYFWNSDIKTYSGFYYDDAEIRNSELSYEVTVTDETGSGGELDLSANTYYYKLVAVFDNGQECPLPDRFYSTDTSSADSTVILSIAVDFSSWNPRITQIKVYRSDTAFGTYKVAQTIDCRATTNDTNVVYADDVIVGAGLYDPNKSWTTDQVKDKTLVVGSSFANIDSHTSNVITMGSDLGAADRLWGEYYSIWGGSIMYAAGFESSVDGWAAVAGDGVARYSPRFHSGAYSLNCSCSQATVADCAKLVTGLTASTTYYFQVWVRSDVAGNSVKLKLDGAVKQTTVIGTTWTLFSGSAATGGSDTDIQVFVQATDIGIDIQIDDVVCSSAAVDSSGTTGYAGHDVVISDEYDYDTDSRENWRVLVGTDTDGNNDSSAQAKRVTSNYGKALKVGSVFTGSYVGSSLKAYHAHHYLWQDSATADIVNLTFYDQGDIAERHYLRGKTKITTNYKYGVYISGRMYGLYVRLDPDGSAENFADLIVFSELDMPDVMPIGNAIRIQDLQGGVITGGLNMNGRLVILAEKGVHVLNLPSVDPNGWELVTAIDKIGNIAPDSVEVAEGVAFFAGNDNIYALTPGYDHYEIADDILDQWQGTSNKENSEFRYDPKKQRMLCRFGDTVDTTWCFDVKRWLKDGETVWTKITTSDVYRISHMAVDEDLQMYGLYDSGTDTEVNYLYGQSGGAELFIPVLKTGIYEVGSLRRSGIFRYLNLGYDCSDLLIAKKFLDRESDPSVHYEASTISFGNAMETDLVQNGGFESAGGGGADVFANWTEWSPLSEIYRNSLYKYAGTYSCSIAAQSSQGYVSQSMSTKQNANYVLSFWLKSQSTNAVGQYKVVGDQTGETLVALTDLAFTTSWVQEVKGFGVGCNTSVTVYLYGDKLEALAVWYDVVLLYLNENVIHDTGAEFINEGFAPGMKVVAEGSGDNDEEVFDIRETSESTLMLATADDLTDETVVSPITLDEVVEFPANNSSGEKHVSNKVSCHATLCQVEIKTLANNTTTLEIYAMEME